MTADVGAPAPMHWGEDGAGAPTESSQLEPAATATLDVPPSWVAIMRLAARIHDTSFVPRALRGQPHEVLAAMLTGDELGLGPMQSLRMINVIEGRPSISAELMRALVNRAGHRLRVVEAKQDRVTLSGQRRDTGATATVTWTLKDAERAQLTKNPAWSKYPRSMLLARATSELCRQIFADIVTGLYTPEETAAIEGTVWEPDDPAELVDPVSQRELEHDEGVSQDPADAEDQYRPAPAESGEVDAGAHLRADASPDQPTLGDVEPERSTGQSDAR